MNDVEPKNIKSYIGTTVVVIVILFTILMSFSTIMRHGEPPIAKALVASSQIENAHIFMVVSNITILNMSGAMIVSIPKKEFIALTNEFNLRTFQDTVIFYKETEQSRKELLAAKKAKEDEAKRNIEILKKNNEAKK